MDWTGRLTWGAPAGRWTILRLGHTPTGIKIAPAPAGGDGLECDKLSREAADFHYDHFLTPLLKELGPELRKALAGQHVDSYEAGWQNWTTTFPQEFQTRRGYNLTKYLPAVTGRIVGDFPTTEKFCGTFAARSVICSPTTITAAWQLAKESKVTTQMGTQGAASESFRRAVLRGKS